MKRIESEKTSQEYLLLTRKQVADLLQISPVALCRKAKDWERVLPPIRLSNSNILRYRRGDVLKFLEQGHGNGND